MSHIQSVCLLGSAAGRNAGDAALISAIMADIDERLGRSLLYRIPTLYPEFVRKTYTHNRVEAINIMPWTGSLKLLGLPTYRAVTRSDLSLVFDAVLFDRELYNPMFNFLSSLYLLLPAAKRAGRKVGLYNCGVGPIRTSQGRRMLKTICEHCDFIAVRDEGSADVLREIGVADERFCVRADAALSAPSASEERIDQIMEHIGLSNAAEIVGLNINKYIHGWSDHSDAKLTRKTFIEELSNAVIQFRQECSAPILLVNTYHGDIPIAQELMKRLSSQPNIYWIDNKVYNHYEIKGVLSRLSILFAMRLHAMILASSSLVPIAGLAYLPKVMHYFDHLGIPDACTDFASFSGQKFGRFMVDNWEKRFDLQRALQESMPQLKRSAKETANYIADL